MSPNHHSKKMPINTIVETLENEDRVLFAYLYGSVVAGEKGNDIDIAVYSATDADPHKLSADLKVDLHKKTGINQEKQFGVEPADRSKRIEGRIVAAEGRQIPPDQLAEAMSKTIQHILAKEKGVAVSGYIDSVVKAHQHGLISADLFQRLKPFFDFRNSLIHRYWSIDDDRLIENIKNGRDDFDRFVEEIEAYLAGH